MDSTAPTLKYREHEGWYVPATEHERPIRRRLKDLTRLPPVFDLCAQKRVALQAGSNWGAWPATFAKVFETVYTFEPDPTNFGALCLNTAYVPNLIRLQAALGAKHGCVHIASDPIRSGACHVDGIGNVPMLLIDDLALDVCDLIYLDIEGCEYAALRGAVRTIEQCRPVLALEDKGWSTRYGEPQGAVIRLAESMGYHIAAMIKKDTVLVPL